MEMSVERLLKSVVRIVVKVILGFGMMRKLGVERRRLGGMLGCGGVGMGMGLWGKV